MACQTLPRCGMLCMPCQTAQPASQLTCAPMQKPISAAMRSRYSAALRQGQGEAGECTTGSRGDILPCNMTLSSMVVLPCIAEPNFAHRSSPPPCPPTASPVQPLVKWYGPHLMRPFL